MARERIRPTAPSGPRRHARVGNKTTRLGYPNEKHSTGSSLNADPERPPIVRRAFEDYATGRFTKQQILERVTEAGLRSHSGRPLGSPGYRDAAAKPALCRHHRCAGLVIKDSVLRVWETRKATIRDEVANAERAVKVVEDKLHRLDEAFLFERTIYIETYDRHAERLREQLTLLRMDRHSGQLEQLDVEGILALAERVLRRAGEMWVQATLDQRQRFQQLFFLKGSRSTQTALFEPPQPLVPSTT